MYGVSIWFSWIVDPPLMTSLQRENLIAYRLASLLARQWDRYLVELNACSDRDDAEQVNGERDCWGSSTNLHV